MAEHNIALGESVSMEDPGSHRVSVPEAQKALQQLQALKDLLKLVDKVQSA